MTDERNLIAEANALVGAAMGATDPDVATLYLARSRAVLDAAREQLHSIEVVVSARESEAVRVAKIGAST